MGAHERDVIARLVCLLTRGYPELDAATRANAQRDVTAFVCSQIGSMPSFLRLPYRIVLAAFNWLPALRYGRPFVSLPDDVASAYLSLWSTRSLGPSRSFVKLIRTCSLLAYYDHPQIRAALANPGCRPSEQGSARRA